MLLNFIIRTFALPPHTLVNNTLTKTKIKKPTYAYICLYAYIDMPLYIPKGKGEKGEREKLKTEITPLLL